MPGRGRPWKGVGEGNPDRIGTGAIADGSITEADLDSSVTSKLNSASGHEVLDEGGSLPQRARIDFVGEGVVASDGIEDTTTVTIGGGRDPTTTAFFEDEFVYQDGTAIQDKYRLTGTATPTLTSLSSNYGKASIESQAGSGNFIQLDTNGSFAIESSSNNLVIKAKWIMRFDDLANTSGVLYFGTSGASGNTQASMMGGINNGFGFFIDRNQDDNWRVFLNGDGNSDVIDTGVQGGLGLNQILEVTYTQSTGKTDYTITEFSGTNTFTQTRGDLEDQWELYAYINAINAGTNRIEIDYWSVESTRV